MERAYRCGRETSTPEYKESASHALEAATKSRIELLSALVGSPIFAAMIVARYRLLAEMRGKKLQTAMALALESGLIQNAHDAVTDMIEATSNLVAHPRGRATVTFSEKSAVVGELVARFPIDGEYALFCAHRLDEVFDPAENNLVYDTLSNSDHKFSKKILDDALVVLNKLLVLTQVEEIENRSDEIRSVLFQELKSIIDSVDSQLNKSAASPGNEAARRKRFALRRLETILRPCFFIFAQRLPESMNIPRGALAPEGFADSVRRKEKNYQAARSEALKWHLHYCDTVISRIRRASQRPPSQSLAWFQGAADVGLLRAIDRRIPIQGENFFSFAWFLIAASIHKELEIERTILHVQSGTRVDLDEDIPYSSGIDPRIYPEREMAPREQKRADRIPDTSRTSSEEIVWRGEVRKLLEQELAYLPPFEQEVLRLHFFEDMTCREIAQSGVKGSRGNVIGEAAINAAKQRALRLLRRRRSDESQNEHAVRLKDLLELHEESDGVKIRAKTASGAGYMTLTRTDPLRSP